MGWLVLIPALSVFSYWENPIGMPCCASSLCTHLPRNSFSLITERSHWSYLNAMPHNRFQQSNLQISTDELVSFSNLPQILIALHFIRAASHKVCCKCALVWAHISGCPEECALLLNAILKSTRHCVCVLLYIYKTSFLNNTVMNRG